MKKKIFLFRLILILLATTSGAVAATPASREGVSSTIDATRLAEVRAWIDRASLDIGRALARISKLPLNEREKSYRHSIDRVLKGSGQMASEFSVRNVLYRAQEVHDVLLTVEPDPKRDAFVRRFLKMSLQAALDYAPKDIEGIDKNDQTVGTLSYHPRLESGTRWARTVVDMSFALPTNESHLTVLKKVMGFLYNDIVHDDANFRRFANVAASLSDEWTEIKDLAPHTPVEKLALIRRIREFLDEELILIATELKISLTPVTLMAQSGSDVRNVVRKSGTPTFAETGDMAVNPLDLAKSTNFSTRLGLASSLRHYPNSIERNQALLILCGDLQKEVRKAAQKTLEQVPKPLHVGDLDPSTIVLEPREYYGYLKHEAYRKVAELLFHFRGSNIEDGLRRLATYGDSKVRENAEESLGKYLAAVRTK